MKTLKLVGGDHMFTIEDMLGKELHLVSPQELQAEKEYFKVVCFMLRADAATYKIYSLTSRALHTVEELSILKL